MPPQHPGRHLCALFSPLLQLLTRAHCWLPSSTRRRTARPVGKPALRRPVSRLRRPKGSDPSLGEGDLQPPVRTWRAFPGHWGSPSSLSRRTHPRGATGEEAQGHGRPVRTATTPGPAAPGPQEARSPPGGHLPTKPGPAFPWEPWNSQERERPGRPQRPATCPSGLLPPRPHPRARGGGPSQEAGTHGAPRRRAGGRARSSPQATPPPHPPGGRLRGSPSARGLATPSRAARPGPPLLDGAGAWKRLPPGLTHPPDRARRGPTRNPTHPHLLFWLGRSQEPSPSPGP